MPDDEKPSPGDQMRLALLELTESNAATLEAVAGYRASAERNGFPSVIADQMALQFHGMLMQAQAAAFIHHQPKEPK